MLPERVPVACGTGIAAHRGRPGLEKHRTHEGSPTIGGVTAETFDALVDELPSAALIVTVAAGGDQGGCLVAFATQCSIEPLRFAVWLSKVNRTYRIARDASTLIVHVLRRGDDDLAHRFAGETGDDADKFRDLDWQPGPDGCPVLTRCDWFGGTIVARVDTGDHEAFVLAPHDGGQHQAGPVLTIDALPSLVAGHPVPPS